MVTLVPFHKCLKHFIANSNICHKTNKQTSTHSHGFQLLRGRLFFGLYLSTPQSGIEPSTSPLEEVRKCHWITRVAGKWHFLPPLNMGWRVRPRGCVCNLAIKIIFYPINSYHLEVVWASSFYQKVQVMGSSSGISLSKTKMGLRLTTNHLSTTPQKWELYTLGTTFFLLIVTTLPAQDFTQ